MDEIIIISFNWGPTEEGHWIKDSWYFSAFNEKLEQKQSHRFGENTNSADTFVRWISHYNCNVMLQSLVYKASFMWSECVVRKVLALDMEIGVGKEIKFTSLIEVGDLWGFKKQGGHLKLWME